MSKIFIVLALFLIFPTLCLAQELTCDPIKGPLSHFLNPSIFHRYLFNAAQMNLNHVSNCRPEQFASLVKIELDRVSNDPIIYRKTLRKTLELIHKLLKNEWTFPHALYSIHALKSREISKDIQLELEMVLKNERFDYWFKN